MAYHGRMESTDLRTKALAVAAMKNGLDEAIAEEQEAAGALLDAALKMAAPELADLVLAEGKHGRRLVLQGDGHLAEVHADGMVVVRSCDAMAHYDLSECLRAIRDALQKQLRCDGTAGAKTARDRIDRLTALVVLTR
jgi:hypothetical protein